MNRPKELFFTYSSSKFQMMRDGFHQEYVTYGITKEQEKKWLEELIEQELNQLNINNKDSLFPLWYILETNCNSTCIDKIIDFIENNIEKSVKKQNLNSFIGKTEETIKRIEKNCQRHLLNLESHKKRIEKLKKTVANTV